MKSLPFSLSTPLPVAPALSVTFQPLLLPHLPLYSLTHLPQLSLTCYYSPFAFGFSVLSSERKNFLEEAWQPSLSPSPRPCMYSICIIIQMIEHGTDRQDRGLAEGRGTPGGILERHCNFP